jgi:ABC-type transport system involved in multi-copper enzyme maturation permease subunit
MDSILSTFLLFIAALTALITYFILPRVPVVALAAAASVALAGGVWWHWAQFSIEYRTSTWQEHLRNYASYVLIFVVILLSYGFYALANSGVAMQDYTQKAKNVIRNTGSRIANILPVTEAADVQASPAVPTPFISPPANVIRAANRNRNNMTNFLA